MPAGKGRRMHVEVLETTMDFVKGMADLQLNITGIANINGRAGANVWRLIKRNRLKNFQGAEDWEVHNTNAAWADMPEHGDDVCLLLKDLL